MAVLVKIRKVDPRTKVEVVVLQDSYGAEHEIQHPMLSPGYDHVVVEQREIEAMAERERMFEAEAARRGHQIEHMKLPHHRGMTAVDTETGKVEEADIYRSNCVECEKQ